MTASTPHRIAVLSSLLLTLLLGACASLPDLPAGRCSRDVRAGAARHPPGAHRHRIDPGRQFLGALRDAARRGVRVRVLLDDLYSGEVADLLAGLAAHEHVEVRLFNPLPLRSGAPMTRLLFSPRQFEQLHRRMHSKLFIADGQRAVTGGRNIGDEYFTHASVANFVDMGLLDHSAVSRQLAEGHLELLFAPVQVLVNAPDKVVQTCRLGDSALGQGLGRLREARSEVVLVSPYFISGVRGMAMLCEATAARVRVTVLTNSMTAISPNSGSPRSASQLDRR